MAEKKELAQLKLAALHLSKLIQAACNQKVEECTSILKRLKLLPAYQKLSLEDIHEKLQRIGLIECKEIIAQEEGESSWRALFNKHTDISALLDSDDYLLYHPVLSNGALNMWFSHYPEAKVYQQSRKNLFLFPYKNTFFVCLPAHIEELGVDSKDKDWQKIGYDWVYPQDEEAKGRLRLKLVEAKQKNI